jgi:hypothetical protein
MITRSSCVTLFANLLLAGLAGCVGSQGSRPVAPQVGADQAQQRAIATVEVNTRAAAEATRAAARVQRSLRR